MVQLNKIKGGNEWASDVVGRREGVCIKRFSSECHSHLEEEEDANSERVTGNMSLVLPTMSTMR